LNKTPERRQFKRSDFPVSAHVDIPGQKIGVQLSDFSLKGARIENDGSWKADIGQKCELRIDLGPLVMIQMQAVVARVDEQYIGLQALEAAQLTSLT